MSKLIFFGRIGSVLLLLAALSDPAWPQSESSDAMSACRGALRQMIFFCTNRSGSSGSNGYACEQRKSDVDRLCYIDRLPELGCAAAQKETQLWCTDKIAQNANPGLVGVHCLDARSKVKNLCHQN
jgi:hypothetical protein